MSRALPTAPRESSVRAVDRGEGDEEKPPGVGLVLDEFRAAFPALEHLQHYPRDGKLLHTKQVDVVPLDIFIRELCVIRSVCTKFRECAGPRLQFES